MNVTEKKKKKKEDDRKGCNFVMFHVTNFITST